MKIDIDHIAKLAQLPLTKDEQELLSSQLKDILSFIEKLSELDTSDVNPTYRVGKDVNILREDVIEDSLTQNDVLSNALRSEDGFIVTKGVFD